jgi:DNA-binding winged helix-turn-helix (wHTH) protein
MGTGLGRTYFFSSFGFDSATGELSQSGQRFRLPDQNARLLTVLLERPGDIVGRDEIRQRVWPDGEHLNHAHAISNGINQIRYALRDNPRSPIFIETLPKRGYRFIAEVRFEDERDATSETFPEPTSDRPTPLDSSLSHDAMLQGIERDEGSSNTGVRAEPAYVHVGSNFRRLVAVFTVLLIIAAGAGVWRTLRLRRSHVPPQEITLGIAPIEASGEAAQKIAEPFRQELVDAASQLPGVQVRAAHSFPLTTSDINGIRSAAERLQLATVLLGKITSQGTSFTFDFELIRGSDAVHLATFHYTGTQAELENIRFRIQQDLFLRLSDTRHKSLSPVRSTENTEAYRDYLTGRADLLHPTEGGVENAVKSFQQATKEDPNFAQAYAGLGSAQLLEAEHLTTDRETSYVAAQASATRAVQINPRIGEAHATLGYLYFRHDWNAQAAEPELKQAIELDPGQAMHYLMYALLLCNTGRFIDALREVDLAHSSDPLWPPIFLTDIYLSSAAHQNARALAAAQKLISIMPDWPLAYDQSAWAFWYSGHREEAVREWIRMATLEQDAARLSLEQQGLDVLRKHGVVAYSQMKLATIHGPLSRKHPNDFQEAEWQVNAGNYDAAIRSLQQMVAAHDPESLQFAASPAYLPLHADPRFKAILRTIGLPNS